MNTRPPLKGKASRELLSRPMSLLLAMWWTGIMSPLLERLRQINSLHTKRPIKEFKPIHLKIILRQSI